MTERAEVFTEAAAGVRTLRKLQQRKVNKIVRKAGKGA